MLTRLHITLQRRHELAGCAFLMSAKAGRAGPGSSRRPRVRNLIFTTMDVLDSLRPPAWIQRSVFTTDDRLFTIPPLHKRDSQG